MMEEIGPKNVLDYAKRFGFEEDFPPYLPIALGAGDATLMEVTSAYTAFANQGMRMKPWSIINVKDREGNLLEAKPGGTDRRHRRRLRVRDDEHPARRAQPERHRGARGADGLPLAAGRAKPARWTTTPTPGSSGSTPTSRLASGSGSTTSGSRLAATSRGAKAALPIWMDFMQAYIDQRPDKDTPPDFQAPGNIVFLAVDKSTGAATTQETPGAITDAFIAGTQPGGISRTQP